MQNQIQLAYGMLLPLMMSTAQASPTWLECAVTSKISRQQNDGWQLITGPFKKTEIYVFDSDTKSFGEYNEKEEKITYKHGSAISPGEILYSEDFATGYSDFIKINRRDGSFLRMDFKKFPDRPGISRTEEGSCRATEPKAVGQPKQRF